VGPSPDLDGSGKFRPTGIRSPDRPARSESLYRLSNPDHDIIGSSDYKASKGRMISEKKLKITQKEMVVACFQIFSP
jgi:hypothetical protein